PCTDSPATLGYAGRLSSMGIELARRDADGLASDPATYWAEGSDGHDGGFKAIQIRKTPTEGLNFLMAAAFE
ncbi:unnamed protein product, partial [Durusdinium trenchii]